MRRVLVSCFDLFLIGSATLMALLLRENLSLQWQKLEAFLPFLLITLGAGAFALLLVRIDRSIWRASSSSGTLGWLVAAAGLTVVIAVVAAFVFNRLDGVSRSLPVIQFVLIVAFLALARALYRANRRRRAAPTPFAGVFKNDQQVTELVVGSSALAEAYIRCVREFGGGKRRVVGLLGRKTHHVGRLIEGVEVLATPEKASRVVESLRVHGVDVTMIVVACPPTELSTPAVSALNELARTKGLTVELLSDRMGLASTTDLNGLNCDAGDDDTSSRMSGDTKGQRSNPNFVVPEDAVARADQPSIALNSRFLKENARRPYWVIKRFLDVLASVTLIVLAAPLFLIVGSCVAISVGFPIIFWQERLGLSGRTFRIYKFRTMRPSHDWRGQRLPDAERENSVCRLLRHSRLDELPQLINILRGDMSFVGPRPLVAEEQSPAVMSRLIVRPGIAGWAQVCGGRNISVADKAALDLWYVKNASVLLDILILLKAFGILLIGERVSRDRIREAWSELGRLGLIDQPACLEIPAGLTGNTQAQTVSRPL